MTTQALLDEYHDLDSEHQTLRAALHQHCDTIKVMERLAQIMERKKEIAETVFNQPRKP